MMTGLSTDRVHDLHVAPGDYTLQLPDTGVPVSVPVTVGANSCHVSLR